MKTPPLRLGMCPLPMETPPLRVGMCSLPMETPPLRLGACLLRMETPLRGRSGGHTGAAPTISRVAPCPKVAGRGSADGLKQKMIAGIGSADGQNRKWLPEEALPTDKIENDCRKRLRRRTKTENTSRNVYFRRGFSAEYAKKMAFLAFGLRNPTFFYYFCG